MSEDVGALWRGQPEEQPPVTLVNRRARELFASTRAEILMSIGAALFFVAVVAWRVPLAGGPRQQVALAALAAWIVITLYRFRGHLRPRDGRDARAMTGLAYYRRELERRRDHLRNEWIWHGPLLLACLIFAATYPNPARLRAIVPLAILLAAWTAFGLWRRRRQAGELQREIDEIP